MRDRATYRLNGYEIKKLKDFVRTHRPGLIHLSSFVVASAFVWSIIAKSRDLTDEEDKNAEDNFVFSIDARTRLVPPVPESYFGKCLALGVVKMKHSELVGDGGFVGDAEAIAASIREKVNRKKKIMEGAENWVSEMRKLDRRRGLSISGSPKFDLYDVDFGWGKVAKFESVSVDEDECAMSV